MTLLVVPIFLLLFGSTLIAGDAEIDPNLLESVDGGQKENILVSFNQDIETVFKDIDSHEYPSDLEKREALTDAEEGFSSKNQEKCKDYLNSREEKVEYESFWICNKMVVRNADQQLVNDIAKIDGVARIEKEPVITLIDPEEVTVEEDNGGGNNSSSKRRRRQAAGSWGIQTIRANQVWTTFTGQGLVVANIDTGVRYTHETLRSRWRTQYGWYDPFLRTPLPFDNNGHGTHTMGTIAGSNGIGVAPEATWIACKGCEGRFCPASQLISCGQFIQCPTRTDGSGRNCSLAPKVVSNSWGGDGSSPWYDEVIASWHRAGIIPVFSIGNSGPDCNTAGTPGERPRVIGVGSTNQNETISSFSSRGPAGDGRMKPDISAPGHLIRSAWFTSDTAYASASGTSMSCPFVSGTAILMLQKNPLLTYDQIYDAITTTAVTSSLDTSSARPCGASNNNFPNNVFGFGRIDAFNSVNAV